jgi:hypothetical protein
MSVPKLRERIPCELEYAPPLQEAPYLDDPSSTQIRVIVLFFPELARPRHREYTI